MSVHVYRYGLLSHTWRVHTWHAVTWRRGSHRIYIDSNWHASHLANLSRPPFRTEQTFLQNRCRTPLSSPHRPRGCLVSPSVARVDSLASSLTPIRSGTEEANKTDGGLWNRAALLRASPRRGALVRCRGPHCRRPRGGPSPDGRPGLGGHPPPHPYIPPPAGMPPLGARRDGDGGIARRGTGHVWRRRGRGGRRGRCFERRQLVGLLGRACTEVARHVIGMPFDLIRSEDSRSVSMTCVCIICQALLPGRAAVAERAVRRPGRATQILPLTSSTRV